MTKKFRLSIQDLLILRSLLIGAGGGYADLKLAEVAMEQAFSAKELAEYQVKQTPDGMTWKTADADGKALPTFKELELGPETVRLVQNMLRKLDEAKALQHFHKTLYEQFIIKPVAEAAIAEASGK